MVEKKSKAIGGRSAISLAVKGESNIKRKKTSIPGYLFTTQTIKRKDLLRIYLKLEIND